MRGQPKVIYYDNAIEFKAINKMLLQLWDQLIVDKDIYLCLANEDFICKVMAKRAAWQGGYYEGHIDVVKATLGKTMRRRISSV